MQRVELVTTSSHYRDEERFMKHVSAFHEACSPGVTPVKASFRADFDANAKVLLIRVAGKFSDDSLAALYAVTRKLSATTGAKVAVADFSLVSEFDLSTEAIRKLACQAGMAEPRIIIAPQPYARVFRMFQGLSECSRPLLQIVHTVQEALNALEIRFPRFGPWLMPALPQVQERI